MIKPFAFLVLLSVSMLSCRERENTNGHATTTQTANDTLSRGAENPADTTEETMPAGAQTQKLLALTADALQIVDQQTGSTALLSFGMPQDQLIGIVSRVLQAPAKDTGINSECGAGPLKMVSWPNGLTLVFKEKEAESAASGSEWQFAGWSVESAARAPQQLSTMAGVGVGSTRSEMEKAYVIEVKQTSLGYEFSTVAGLYGIFDGPGQQAKITNLWSGLSCNFR
ncbi:hypothetical protein [Cesiribacter sp. SM1]|uniref:hypothetical protein n=1 Tax=Cesiribacter sp. SM1 TaxID=2861196 RepID=UPI001CD3A89D|nr:hypothetical protein [Cesiribacter sp. SM1]